MGREIEEETVSPASKPILSPGPIKAPHEIRAEAIRDLLGTAQHLNRQAAALRRIGYEVQFVSGPDMAAVAVSLCPEGVDRG